MKIKEIVRQGGFFYALLFNIDGQTVYINKILYIIDKKLFQIY
jgi:hypothetical protein